MELTNRYAEDGPDAAPAAGRDYRIPKREVVAEVRLSGEPPREVRLYLSETAERHSGPERPSDLLNGGRAFIPATDPDGRHMILHRGSIIVLTVPAAEELDASSGAGIDVEPEGAESHEVELHLTGGLELSGSLHYVRPRGQRRPLDYLNTCDPFFTICEDDRVHVVNRGHVLVVFPD